MKGGEDKKKKYGGEVGQGLVYPYGVKQKP